MHIIDYMLEYMKYTFSQCNFSEFSIVLHKATILPNVSRDKDVDKMDYPSRYISDVPKPYRVEFPYEKCYYYDLLIQAQEHFQVYQPENNFLFVFLKHYRVN